jgi:ABC-type proline/glycine betaine transport system permease subunit
VRNNLAFILEGAVPTALLAILVGQFLSNIESSFAYTSGRV